LARSGHKRLIKDLQQDVSDGVLLAEIIQVIGERFTFSKTQAKRIEQRISGKDVAYRNCIKSIFKNIQCYD